MKPELDEGLSRFHAAIVGGAKGEEATRAIPPLSGTINAPVEYLDLATVIKVSQAVSGEIVQEKQLEILMRTAIEQAGAERGVLFLSRWSEPRIAAQATTGDGGIVVKLYDEAMTPAVLPESVIQYVVRTSESVILDDAAAQNPFSADPYIRQQRARSVLCLPFLNQGQLIGVLYLENNLIPGVFAPARIAVLKLLASQAAISLANARLYRDLRAIIDNAPVFLWSDLPDGYCDFLNQPWLTYFNLSLQEAQGAGWAAALHPDDAAHHLESWQKSVSTGSPFETEARFRRSDGEYRWFLTRANPLRDKTGRIVKWYGTNIDIENLKRTEARLRSSEGRYARAMEAAGDGHTEWNLETDEFYVSPRQLEICGYAPGTTFKDRAEWVRRYPFHPEDRAKWEAAVAAHFAGCEARFQMEARIVVRGETRWVSMTRVAERDASGRPIRWTGSTTDITERKRAELALRTSEERYARAMEGSDAGHWDWNVVTDEMFVSERAREMLGLPADIDLPRTHAELMALVPMHPDDRSAMHSILAASIASGRHEREYRVIPRAGELRWLRSRGKIYHDARGAAVRMTGSLADITESKLAAEALRESEARFRNLTEISSDFFWETDAGHRYSSIEFGEAYVGIRDLSFKLGRARWEIPSPSPGEAGWAAHRAVLAAHQRFFDFGFSRIENGKERFYEISGEPRFDAEGRFLGYRGVGRDVTERERAEQELRRSQHYLAEAQKVGHTGSWAWSPVSNAILYWSEECYRILGYDPAQGLPSFESSFERIHPEDQPALVETIERAVREKTEFQIEYRLVLPDGTQRHVRILSHPVLDASGKLVEFVGTVMDVTEQKRAEEERKEHLQFLESMDRINRAMQRTNDVEPMIGGVLEETLAIFGCERACLVYPCDPDTPTWRVVAERATPQYAGEFTLDKDFPTSPEGAKMFRRVLQQAGPLVDPELRADRRAQFHIASMIIFAVRPRGDRPYMFAMHQCSGPRAWTGAERRLFEEIARRLEDTLTSVLAHRNVLAREKELRRSQHYLAEGQKLSHTGSWAWNPLSNTILYWSEECYRIYGCEPAHGLPSAESVFERFHPEDLPAVLKTVDKAMREKVGFQLEHRLILPGGIVRNLRCLADTVLNASGELIQYIGTVMDVTEQKRADEERKEHLWFLESMDRVNRAMQRTNDVEGMMSGVLEETLAIFGSDRARLVYPCDPDAATCRVVMEHTRPEYPGAFALGEELPVDPPAAEVLRRALDGPGALTDLGISPEIRERFSIQSAMAIAVRPKGDRPYLFGLHQCSHARDWSAAERRLFEEIARRLEDALTSVLAHRNLLAREKELRRSQHYLSEAQKLSHTGSWAWNPISNAVLYWSAESYRIYGFDPAQGIPPFETTWQRVHPEDRDALREANESGVREKAVLQLEHRYVLPGGIVRNHRVLAHPVLNASGELIEYLGTVVDVTEQKRAEEERKEHLWFLECMDRINRAMQRTNAVEGMMSGVLEETLAIFGLDRAWLVYPCDPDAATSRVVMEHTRPEYPGAFALGEEFPVDTRAAELLRRVLDGPGAATDLSVPPEIRERFSIQSIMAIAVRPKGDRPYLFGLHQCSHARAWTAAERRLFEEIARRLEDALTSVLAHRNLLASQEELRASEERFRTFVDHATDAFFLYDEECIVLDVNRQACEALGYTREELIGMHPTQFNEDMTQERALRIKQRLQEHGSATYSARRRRKDGSLFPVEERLRAFNRGGRVLGIGLASDITDRRHREQRLLAQFRVTQTLSQVSSLEKAAPRILCVMCEALEWDLGVLWQVDPEGGVLRCIATWPSASAAPPNFAAATRAISFGPGMGLPGRVWSSGGPVCIRDVALDPELPRAKSAAKEGLHAAFAFPVMLKSGIVGVIELFSREVRDADRGLLQMMAAIGSQVAQFIERTRAEDALRDAREKLAQASKIASLAELSASIAHEINQPLQAIVANGHASLRWLDAAPPNIEKAISTAKRVVRDGNAAAEVVSRIRALFQHAAPAKIDLDINKLILQVGILMADEIQGTAVSLEAELGEDVPRIRADAVQIQQVIVNLVRNAIEAMAGARRKPLLIRSRRSASHVVVDVRDQGTGLVDPEKIFEPFVSTKGTGMGMGLTICRSIIEAHGGDIRVMHNEGPGVTFSFSLPLEASDAT